MNQILPYLAEHSSSATLKSDSSVWAQPPSSSVPISGHSASRLRQMKTFSECLYFSLLSRAAMERQRAMVGGVRCVSWCVTACAGYYREPNSKQLIPGGAQTNKATRHPVVAGSSCLVQTRKRFQSEQRLKCVRLLPLSSSLTGCVFSPRAGELPWNVR